MARVQLGVPGLGLDTLRLWLLTARRLLRWGVVRRVHLRGVPDPVGPHLARAWRAFGRLLHTAQDFYAHTNYVYLWAGRYNGSLPSPKQIEPLDPALLASPDLHTVRSYPPLGYLANLPLLGRSVFPFLPPDAHGRMSLDASWSGPLFPYAMAAATRRSVYEFNKTLELIGEAPLINSFVGEKMELRGV